MKREISGMVKETMDTPERSKTTASLSKFEDSPVFSFLNSLSPIKPVKSVHITQTFNSLSFGSSPSVFTSPHISLKESRFLRRHQLCDPLKPEFVDKDDTTEGIVEVAPSCTENQETLNSRDTVEASVDRSYECSKIAADLVQTPSYDLGSLNSSQIPTCGHKTKLTSETAGSSGVHVPYVQEEYNKVFQGTEANMDGISQIDQNNEAIECDWQLISDVADLLTFSSPYDTEAFEKSMDPETSFYALVSNNAQNPQTFVEVGSGDQLAKGSELDNQFTQRESGNEPKEVSETQDTRGTSSLGINCMAVAPIDSMDPEAVSNLYRGMRTRCLDFDLSGARRKRFDENSTSDSTMSSLSNGLTTYGDKQLVPANTGNESSRCALPGIGLHLNAFTTTSKDCKVVKNEVIGSGRELLTATNSATTNRLLNIGLDSSNKLVNVTQSDRDISLVGDGTQLLEDSGQASGHLVNEEYSQNSPKKKRLRSEDGEAGACKRCNCKKSKCLKLYCECFAAGVYCVEPCSCLDCFNKPVHEDTVLATRKQIESRNPLAFAPKVIRISDPLSEAGEESNKTPASARHKRGCNCKKSGCLKKYCECYQGGVGCSINCRCEGCKNAFGRKDGSASIGSEVEPEEEETDTSERSMVDGNQQKTVIPSDAEPNLDYFHPATPLTFGRCSNSPLVRPSLQLVFPSNNKPTRSTFLPVGSSPALYASQGLRKPNVLPPSKVKNDFGTVPEDEMPEILQTNRSSNSVVKSASPNNKRVSPPHLGRRILSGQSSSRKLILQSIPSFPSLSPKH